MVKITVEGDSMGVTYFSSYDPDKGFLEDLKRFKAFALEVAKALNMGKDPTITIEEVLDND